MTAVMQLGAGVLAQKVKAGPAPVAAALKEKYPQATNVTWEKEKGNFEASWGGKSSEDMSVMFTPNRHICRAGGSHSACCASRHG